MSNYEIGLDLGHSNESEPTVLFRHKTIMTFCVGDFQFRNFQMRLPESRKDEFIELLRTLPQRDSANIVIINEAALAAVEQSLGSANQSVVRGMFGADDIKTAKDADVSGAGAGGTPPAGTLPSSTPGQAGGVSGMTALLRNQQGK